MDVDVVASVLIRSERTIRCAVASSEEFATKLTQNFFGQAPDIELPPGMLEDGIGEFLNMVAGNAVTGLKQRVFLAVDPPIRGPSSRRLCIQDEHDCREICSYSQSSSNAPVSK